jgi:hypothetical protein
MVVELPLTLELITHHQITSLPGDKDPLTKESLPCCIQDNSKKSRDTQAEI